MLYQDEDGRYFSPSGRRYVLTAEPVGARLVRVTLTAEPVIPYTAIQTLEARVAPTPRQVTLAMKALLRQADKLERKFQAALAPVGTKPAQFMEAQGETEELLPAASSARRELELGPDADMADELRS